MADDDRPDDLDPEAADGAVGEADADDEPEVEGFNFMSLPLATIKIGQPVISPPKPPKEKTYDFTGDPGPTRID